MKAILMSIRPQWVAKILNGEKTIEIRKKFPSDYVGWVYIYATKDSKYIYRKFNGRYFKLICSTNTLKQEIEDKSTINGQVVARFWCDKVEDVSTFGKLYFLGKVGVPNELSQLSCLSQQELDTYLQGKNGYAIHITKLEIFDEPKEISEFTIDRKIYKQQLYRAPQSWCYVEV